MAGPAGLRTRRFRFRYAARCEAAGARLWFPIPQSGEFQQIELLSIDAPGYSVAEDDSRRNRVGFTTAGRASFECAVTRTEHRRLLGKAGAESMPPPARDLARHLQPERLVPLDMTIRRWATEVTRDARTDLDKARAIYNHVVATVKYDKSGKGWGRGDIYYACDARRGNCTDFHAIFIGYCRAVGVPARFAIGFPLPPDRRSGRIEGYHCWAEFYARGEGWVPVDASEAAKDPLRREYYFGAHDEHRVELTRGRDIRLRPAQQGEPLNYFVYPYAEADGRAVEAKLEVSFEDLAG
jgi:transglutaminase-like putative cysteine protease